jgi:hypothetical protein
VVLGQDLLHHFLEVGVGVQAGSERDEALVAFDTGGMKFVFFVGNDVHVSYTGN